MKLLTETHGSVLEWVETEVFNNSYELRNEKDIFASLMFRTALGTMATAEILNGKWTLKRVGFLDPKVTVRESNADVDSAIYYPKYLGGGHVTFTDKATFNWKPVNAWQTHWAFYDSTQRAVVDFSPGTSTSRFSDLFKTQATVKIEFPKCSAERLALLTVLGFYLIVLHNRESAEVVPVD